MSQELQALELPAKVAEALVAAGLDSVDKLVEYEVDNEFTAIAGIGDAGAAQIKQALAQAGAYGGGDGDGGGDETNADGARLDDKGEPLLDPEQPGISPGERGRRYERIARQKLRDEIAAETGVALPVADPVTARGYIAPKKTAIVRGGQLYTPDGNDEGETKIALVELCGECSANYLADSIAGGAALPHDESGEIETDPETGERITPATYSIRLTNARRVGNHERPRGHVIARVMVPNYRIPVADILGGLLRTQSCAFFEDKRRRR